MTLSGPNVNPDPTYKRPALPRRARRKARHPDEIAVDRFAAAMKKKLAKKRAEGYCGWEDPNRCSTKLLSHLLREHVVKGDPVDVGNFAMMLWNRRGATNEGAQPQSEPTEAQIKAGAAAIEGRQVFDAAHAREIAEQVLRAARAVKESE